MISEQITVTTAPISIRQLIATARGVNIDVIPKGCSGIMMRVAFDSTKVVTLTDTDAGGSATGAVVCDAANNLVSTSFANFGIDRALLNCDSTTITVHVIVQQRLI
jgi:hypothetical protein